MPDKFQGKYRIPSARLQGYDYGQNGAYFITICTKNRIHYFGEIISSGVETQYFASLRYDKIQTPRTAKCGAFLLVGRGQDYS